MHFRRPVNPWMEIRSESARNWLALGLLLAAWNFSDNDAVGARADKPAPLQKYTQVTVKAVRAQVSG